MPQEPKEFKYKDRDSRILECTTQHTPPDKTKHTYSTKSSSLISKMSSNCTITIKNQSGLPQQYILFAAPPKISASPRSGVFTNIYMTAPTVPNTTGSARFSVTNNFFAVCGTNKTPLSSKVQVSTLDYKAVVLGTAGRSGTTARVKVTDGAPQFDKSTSSPKGHVGAFAIQACTDFFLPNSSKSSLPTRVLLH